MLDASPMIAGPVCPARSWGTASAGTQKRRQGRKDDGHRRRVQCDLGRSGGSRPRAHGRSTPASIAGSCRRARSASICASACPMGSACSGCRSRARSASRRPSPARTRPCSATSSPRAAIGRSRISSSFSPSASCCSALSAAVFGGWVEREGPRKAGFVAALCWGGGFVLSALGVYSISFGFCGSGSGSSAALGSASGYISPVSTLVKWFPDRRGMATGMAIMGFGGGAMIGSPLANLLMNYFKTPDFGRRLADRCRDGRRLFRLHDGRRLRLSGSARGLAARGLDAAARRQAR